jgi:hypothetical protein
MGSCLRKKQSDGGGDSIKKNNAAAHHQADIPGPPLRTPTTLGKTMQLGEHHPQEQQTTSVPMKTASLDTHWHLHFPTQSVDRSMN